MLTRNQVDYLKSIHGESQTLWIAGSRTYGTSYEGSDWDIRGLFFTNNPIDVIIRSERDLTYTTVEYTNHLLHEGLDYQAHHFVKFVSLLSKANPTLAEVVVNGFPICGEGLVEELKELVSLTISKNFAGPQTGMLAEYDRRSKSDNLNQVTKALIGKYRIILQSYAMAKSHNLISNIHQLHADFGFMNDSELEDLVQLRSSTLFSQADKSLLARVKTLLEDGFSMIKEAFSASDLIEMNQQHVLELRNQILCSHIEVIYK
ncbi:MAG: DNA polymerase beta superfamily protein [Patescibacteria group bacterium]